MVRKEIVVPDGMAFRAMSDSDQHFVLSSFRLCQHDRAVRPNPWCQMFFNDAMDALTEILHNVLQKASCVILYDTADFSSIIGYVIFERTGRKCCIHWLYVKEAFRGLQWGKLLFQFATRGMHEDDPVWISSLTNRARNILDKKKVAWSYKPALLFSRTTFQEENKQDNAQ